MFIVAYVWLEHYFITIARLELRQPDSARLRTGDPNESVGLVGADQIC